MPGRVRESASIFGLKLEDEDSMAARQRQEDVAEEDGAFADLTGSAVLYKDPDTISVLGLVLSEGGYHVKTVDSPESFLVAIQKMRPDIVAWAGRTMEQLESTLDSLRFAVEDSVNIVVAHPPELNGLPEFEHAVKEFTGERVAHIRLPAPVWEVQKALIHSGDDLISASR